MTGEPTYVWTNDDGQEFGAKGDSVEEARREIDNSPIISDREATIANDNPPTRVEDE